MSIMEKVEEKLMIVKPKYFARDYNFVYLVKNRQIHLTCRTVFVSLNDYSFERS